MESKKNHTRTWMVISTCLALLSLALSVATWTRRPPRLAYINAPKVIEAYKNTPAIRTELQQKTATWRANADTLAKEMEAAIRKFERERPTMTAKEQELSLQLLGTKRDQIDQYRQSTDDRIRTESDRVTADLIKEINTLTQAYARKQGYDFLLGASGNGNLIYADEAMDISDEVIKAINQD